MENLKIENEISLSFKTKTIIVISSIVAFVNIPACILAFFSPGQLNVGLSMIPSVLGVLITNWFLIKENKFAWFIPAICIGISLPGSIIMMIQMVSELSRAGDANWGGGLTYVYFVVPALVSAGCFFFLMGKKIKDEFKINESKTNEFQPNVKKSMIIVVFLSVVVIFRNLFIGFNPALFVANLPYITLYIFVFILLNRRKIAAYYILIILMASQGLSELISVFHYPIYDYYFFVEIVGLFITALICFILTRKNILREFRIIKE